jgi:multiple sugar transport system ATP-binding protein
LLDSAGPLEGKVHAVENHGVEKIVTLRVQDLLLRVTVPARTVLELDSSIRFAFNDKKLHCFDAESGQNLFFGD